MRVFVGLDALGKELEYSTLRIKGLKGELFKYSQGSHLGAGLFLVGVTLGQKSWMEMTGKQSYDQHQGKTSY